MAAVVFVVVIFSIKSNSSFKNKLPESGLSGGLTYNSSIVKDLINKDSDKDGIADWEESLWGTSPNLKDTDANGVTDDKEIAQLKIELKQNVVELGGETAPDESGLTQTDKFSQELLTTMAALNQNGEMDQATIEKLGESLATQIENAPQKKIFGLKDIKIVKDDRAEAILQYNNTLNSITRKYPTNPMIKI